MRLLGPSIHLILRTTRQTRRQDTRLSTIKAPHLIRGQCLMITHPIEQSCKLQSPCLGLLCFPRQPCAILNISTDNTAARLCLCVRACRQDGGPCQAASPAICLWHHPKASSRCAMVGCNSNDSAMLAPPGRRATFGLCRIHGRAFLHARAAMLGPWSASRARAPLMMAGFQDRVDGATVGIKTAQRA